MPQIVSKELFGRRPGVGHPRSRRHHRSVSGMVKERGDRCHGGHAVGDGVVNPDEQSDTLVW